MNSLDWIFFFFFFGGGGGVGTKNLKFRFSHFNLEHLIAEGNYRLSVSVKRYQVHKHVPYHENDVHKFIPRCSLLADDFGEN